MTSPYDGILALGLTPKACGWPNSSSDVLTEHAAKANLIIEVGSFMGLSLWTMAKANPNARFYAVDTWLGSPEIGDDDNTPYQFGRVMHLERFLTNMVAAGIDHRVTPIIQTSQSGARILRKMDVRADLIYIDAGHEYLECYCDLLAYLPLLAPHGVMIADDYGDFPGVRAAVERFSCEAGMQTEIRDGKAIMRPRWRVRVDEEG